ncbi:uncharacterized protein LOC127719876 [Mytilus californianus]|uniref:uncharacterized protein LOC127719876 n=1 Tax=Mytilus californianus TaxID=6549 RepID=UPI002247C2BE|nr:uncharacterized protein LOC127719876 [Mytilus californianus]XP_052082184.1 uncharacterized protein LOC127719876 [Mytilus californianus]XP_052082185.1 uncharacterized protein LOC127719876 [Mytilus californianus]XP_052082187.1 uncharacterized protein LOC127719876 [Mytilus californianus]XP_052082188.1 uncharacterized protein LOC127719876 [Mytilus californianus]
MATFTLLVSAIVVVMCHASKEENMGSGSTSCGKSIILPKEDRLSIYSKGNAKGGFCSILLHAMEDTSADCPYRSFCVAVTQMSMSSCSAKIFLTGTSYDVIGIKSKEISCFSHVYGAWCTQSKSLEISVIEDPTSNSNYGFNLTVLSECRSTSSGEFDPVKDNTSKKIDEIEAEMNQNRIIGVVVGISLACMFLIIMFVSYQYYKNKPTYRQQRDM